MPRQNTWLQACAGRKWYTYARCWRASVTRRRGRRIFGRTTRAASTCPRILNTENTVLHIDTRRYYCRDQVRDGILKLRKCAGPLNVADANTKSLPSPAFTQHREHMWGSRVPFAAFDYQNMPTSTEMTEEMIIPDFSKLDISRNFPRGQTAGG